MNIICGDAVEVLRNMPSKSVNCCVTSPPYYGLRDYGTGNHIDLYIDSHDQALAMGVYKTNVSWR